MYDWSMSAASDSPHRRAHGEASRERLLHTALRLFAEQGYAKATTRQIAHESGANVGAIAYYFGDKLGLYKAAFLEPLGSPHDDMARFTPVHLTLEEALTAVYEGFLEPLRKGEITQWCMRLHCREMIEPTGVWQDEIQQGIVPCHRALMGVLARHLGAGAPSVALERLALSIVAQGVFSVMARDVTHVITPHLFSNDAAIDEMVAHYTRCALAMVAAERQRINSTLSTQ